MYAGRACKTRVQPPTMESIDESLDVNSGCEQFIRDNRFLCLKYT